MKEAEESTTLQRFFTTNSLKQDRNAPTNSIYLGSWGVMLKYEQPLDDSMQEFQSHYIVCAVANCQNYQLIYGLMNDSEANKLAQNSLSETALQLAEKYIATNEIQMLTREKVPLKIKLKNQYTPHTEKDWLCCNAELHLTELTGQIPVFPEHLWTGESKKKGKTNQIHNVIVVSISSDTPKQEGEQCDYFETSADVAYILLDNKSQIIAIYGSSESLSPQELGKEIISGLTAMYMHYDMLKIRENLDPNKEPDPAKGAGLLDTIKKLKSPSIAPAIENAQTRDDDTDNREELSRQTASSAISLTTDVAPHSPSQQSYEI